MALVMATISADAQWFDLSNNKDRYEIGLNLGQAKGGRYSGFGIGASFNVWGVYIDFISAGPEHKYDNHHGDFYWEDSVAYAINLGYQIPIIKWLYVMPLIGYSQSNAGITDASTLNIETNENSSQLSHDYNVTPGTRRHRFNYGVGLVLHPIEWLSLYGVYSRYAVYGGLSFNLGALE